MYLISLIYEPCPPEHLTPASLLCAQDLVTFTPRWPQAANANSLPEHETLSSQIDPDPWPKPADPMAVPDDPNPSCLHTTPASVSSHPSSHTVPHSPL